MTNRKYFSALNVGMALTFSGGIAIGGDGKSDPRVVRVAKTYGFSKHPHTGEWFRADSSGFSEIEAALELL